MSPEGMSAEGTSTGRRAPIAAPKGVIEYLPPASEGFLAVRDAVLAQAALAGYGYIEAPAFESTELFVRGVGESTDVVSKEMYTFDDRGGRSLSLRPEGTAGVIRSIIEHGLDRGALPVKLAYAGPMFRAERPQAGRYRQFFQVGIEAVGVDDPALDAEAIAIADASLRRLGLTGYRMDLTSLGDAACRPQYRALLQGFLAGLDLDEDTRRRAAINPLRVLDDKRPHVRSQLGDAPLMLDHLCDDCAAHFAQVQAHLDALGVQYTVNPLMVRGLDYYTKTTFEFVHGGLGAQAALGGGGRYDGLMGELGGQELSGIGFAIGIDRVILAAAAEGAALGGGAGVGVYLVPLGEPARAWAVGVLGQLRAAGITADMAYGSRGLKGAMKGADRSGARFAVIVGDRDLDAGAAQVKELATGDQTEIAMESLVERLVEQLSTATPKEIDQ
jgi:histidyl-tRNA synthetase